MTSRRSLLAGIGGAGAAALAGCTGVVPWRDDGTDRADVALAPDAVEPVERSPSPFPVAVPESLAAAHGTRARELLGAVPADPSLPNAAVERELRNERERAADRIENGSDRPWPTDRLAGWRAIRSDAATVRGAHRAATGEDDSEAVRGRRRAAREDLASFVAAHEYRARSPLEATLVHAPVEDLVATCRRRVRPVRTYPADPVARPFRAGEAVGWIEGARATLDDATGLLETYRARRDGTDSWWSSLIASARRLRLAVDRERTTVGRFLERDDPPVDEDLRGTPARRLLVEASRRAERLSEDVEERVDDGAVATAAVGAGRALAAIETLSTAVEGVRDGAYRDRVTAESVGRAADRARESLAGVAAADDPRLAARIAEPAFGTHAYVVDRIDEGHADPVRAQGDLAFVDLYARAVPPATRFVLDRLD
ncbi:hypothetical protein [Halorubrum halodurans]|uniref:Uncharacterized protein n=1 Tax=Halorubrum halodurans TaxID=1383851 RepID=A0A256IKH1_9EURY|nr:hypothetical protein [Halorubrum halodurans]OYR57040.1 hypothetical protein DJ70_06855 [Halorubrum halodurans]